MPDKPPNVVEPFITSESYWLKQICLQLAFMNAQLVRIANAGEFFDVAEEGDAP